MKQEQKGQPLSNLSNTELVIAKMMENNAQGRPGNEAVKLLGFGGPQQAVTQPASPG